ncbi:MAG: winged helix-turn-helix transcriptional regulator [Acidimicrobiales bacterium]|nr:winged helix-turn-helix transcriptional regulator [Acidimicrobiales bacterium]MCB1261891.1 winged helix-turn-helix transcriptional regulator [Acidimicrobiales bacterium]
MVVSVRDDATADKLFHALADATRRDILRCTMHGEHSVSALARRYPMSVTAVQKHVGVLEQAALVTKERRGREQLVRCNIDTIRTAQRLLDEYEQVWRGRIDRMGDVLAASGDSPPAAAPPADTPPADTAPAEPPEGATP